MSVGIERPERFCQYPPCGRLITGPRTRANYATRKFCGRACARRAVGHNPEPPEPKICPECQNPFLPNKGEEANEFKRRMTCSPACANVLRTRLLRSLPQRRAEEAAVPKSPLGAYPEGFVYEDVPGLDVTTLDSAIRR